MAKKKNASASATAKAIENLKNLNNQLVNEVCERRKQIEQLRFDLSSSAADHDILSGMERDVLGLVISSSISEAAARITAEMKKNESTAAAELNAAEMHERDAVRREIERIIQKRDSSPVADEECGGRGWRKWICPVAAMATVAAVAVVAFCCCKGSGLEN